MLKTLRRLQQYRQLISGHAEKDFHVVHVKHTDYTKAAQRLHATVYLDCGYVEPHMVSKDGRITVEHDPYQKHSDYFVVFHRIDEGREVLATARQIRAVEKRGHHSYPTFSHLKLYAKERKRLEQVNPNHYVEISALAKRRHISSTAVLLLYRAMWHHSLRSGHLLWLMAVDAKLYGQLRFFFGDTLTQAGPKTFYMGSEVVPAILNVPSSVETLKREVRAINPIKRHLRRELVKFFLTGAPASQ